jgi:hypothetical protein
VLGAGYEGVDMHANERADPQVRVHHIALALQDV